MIDEKLTERLPVVRITPTLKQRLERVVIGRRLGEMSDHVRFALEEYVASEESKLIRQEAQRRNLAVSTFNEGAQPEPA